MNCLLKYNQRPIVPVNRGLTLVELLIAVAIIVAAMAIAVPVVRLISDDNKVAIASQEVRSFITAIAKKGSEDGRSCVIFERNANAPDYCYRLVEGRIRPNYQGEDLASYAVRGAEETVTIPGIGDYEFQVFFFYNADVSKFVPFELFSLSGRDERYLIYKAFTTTTVGAGPAWDRPTVKVFCAVMPEDPLGPNGGNSIASDHSSAPAKLDIFSASINSPFTWSDTTNIGLAVYRDTSATPGPPTDGPMQFFAADGSHINNAGSSNRIPYGVLDTETQGYSQVSQLFKFSVTQPPVIDELNFVELPESLAINLGASGFGAGSLSTGDGILQGFTAFRQFAYQNNGTMPATTDMSLVSNKASPARTFFFPRIEFGSGGRIERVFAISPNMTNFVSVAGAGVVNTPFQPSGDLFLLLGEVDPELRPSSNAASISIPSLLPNDHWIVANGQNGSAKVITAETSVSLQQSRLIASRSVSEK